MKVLADIDVTEFLKDAMDSSENQVVRFEIAGMGWGGPKFRLVLDEQSEKDCICETNGVKFAVAKRYDFFVDGIELIKTEYGIDIKNSGSCG